MMMPEEKMKKMMKEVKPVQKNVVSEMHSTHSPSEMAKYCKTERANQGGFTPADSGHKVKKFHKGS